jgi:hypothetical protein
MTWSIKEQSLTYLARRSFGVVHLQLHPAFVKGGGNFLQNSSFDTSGIQSRRVTPAMVIYGLYGTGRLEENKFTFEADEEFDGRECLGIPETNGQVSEMSVGRREVLEGNMRSSNDRTLCLIPSLSHSTKS